MALSVQKVPPPLALNSAAIVAGFTRFLQDSPDCCRYGLKLASWSGPPLAEAGIVRAAVSATKNPFISFEQLKEFHSQYSS